VSSFEVAYSIVDQKLIQQELASAWRALPQSERDHYPPQGKLPKTPKRRVGSSIDTLEQTWRRQRTGIQVNMRHEVNSSTIVCVLIHRSTIFRQTMELPAWLFTWTRRRTIPVIITMVWMIYLVKMLCGDLSNTWKVISFLLRVTNRAKSGS
jgi:hypothetical protein